MWHERDRTPLRGRTPTVWPHRESEPVNQKGPTWKVWAGSAGYGLRDLLRRRDPPSFSSDWGSASLPLQRLRENRARQKNVLSMACLLGLARRFPSRRGDVSPALCAGCDHVHLDGRAKPCACGCSGFIRSMAAFATAGRENPDCEECRADGRHPADPPKDPR